EDGKPAVFTAASFQGDRELFNRVERAFGINLGIYLPNDKQHLTGLARSGVAIRTMTPTRITCVVALEYETPERADAVYKFLHDKQLPLVAGMIERDLGIVAVDALPLPPPPDNEPVLPPGTEPPPAGTVPPPPATTEPPPPVSSVAVSM